MDCGVQVVAGKPLIIAEDLLENPDKTLTKSFVAASSLIC
jgi:hypothetical protein